MTSEISKCFFIVWLSSVELTLTVHSVHSVHSVILCIDKIKSTTAVNSQKLRAGWIRADLGLLLAAPRLELAVPWLHSSWHFD